MAEARAYSKIHKISDYLGKKQEKVFFKWRTSKRVGEGVKPPDPLRKNTFFYQLKKMTKPHEPLSSRGGGHPDLSCPTSRKKNTFLCVFSLREAAKKNIFLIAVSLMPYPPPPPSYFY